LTIIFSVHQLNLMHVKLGQVQVLDASEVSTLLAGSLQQVEGS
jgi:hypothetical protein